MTGYLVLTKGDASLALKGPLAKILAVSDRCQHVRSWYLIEADDASSRKRHAYLRKVSRRKIEAGALRSATTTMLRISTDSISNSVTRNPTSYAAAWA